MRTNCIFNTSKQCNSCGECDACDLTPGKKCNNCGKCLEMEGYDIKAIQIDQVFEEAGEYVDDNSEDANVKDNDSVEEIEETIMYESDYDINDNNDRNNKTEYIDDIEEIKGVLDGGEIIDPLAKEAFPGLIILNKKNKL